MTSVPDQRILLVHAHPDDETIQNGATMANYVAMGRGVTLVTCTAGEMGEILAPELEHLAADKDDGLGEHRRGELADAMKELGVTDHRFLGGFGAYRDSGMQWHDDGYAIPADETHENAFWHADLREAADHLVRVIREVRPQVLVTYDEFGNYGHPDHIQAHRVSTYAAALAAVPSYKPDIGEVWDIAKVYWCAMSENRFRTMLRRLREEGDTETFEGMDPEGDFGPWVTSDAQISARIDGTDLLDVKLAALARHRSQVEQDGVFFRGSENGQSLFGEEFYRLAKGEQGPVDDNGWETDLFAWALIIGSPAAPYDDPVSSNAGGAAGSERAGFRVVVAVLVVLGVLLGGGYVAAYAGAQDKTPQGTTVGGVDVGGLTLVQAAATLKDGLAARADAAVTVEVDGQQQAATPAELGLGVDYVASVRDAGVGRSWDPVWLWNYYTGGEDLDPVVTVSEMGMTDYLTGLAEATGRPARDGEVTFKGTRVQEVKPRAGRSIDPAQAREAIVAAYLSDDPTASLELVDTPPEIDDADVREAVESFANPAVSAAVTLVFGNSRVRLQPRDFASTLSLRPSNGKLEPHVNQKKLLRLVDDQVAGDGGAPVDATVALVGGRPQVIPAKPGVEFEPAEVTTAFTAALTKPEGEREAKVTAEVRRADFTTAEARALKIVEQVSTFTTYFPYAEYRNTNIGRAMELINGTVLKPGETFSLNQTVGERTAENGFVKGFIIENGIFKEDYGGGVSQSATTTFNAAFFAGLEDVEHKPHSFYIDRYPVGREATVAWPTVDLKFKNDTPYGVLIQAGITPSSSSAQGSATVTMWSTKYWDITTSVSHRYNLTQPKTRRLDTEDCYPNEGYGGFDVDVTRHFHLPSDPSQDRDEVMHTHYIPSDTVICTNPNAG